MSESPIPDPGQRRGFTLTEVSLATFVMALAFLPVAGLITQGLHQTDVSVGFTTAMDIAQATMNALLDPEVTISQIPLTPLPVTFTQFDNTVTSGSVGADALLNPIIPSQYNSTVENGRRVIRQVGLPYFVDIWTAVLRANADLTFHCYQSPHVRYDTAPQDQSYYRTMALGDGDWAWSPYNEGIAATRMYSDGKAWAQTEQTVQQRDFSTTTTALNPVPATAVYANLMKILLRVSWPQVRNGPPTRSFWLTTFKARLK
jgi:hypothetical protein